MATVRDIIKRDIGVKVEGVVKVFDRSALANEVREYVVTDKIEDELKRIVDTFTQVSETLRRGGAARDVMGMWVSGFFGSGKSHFAKVLGYLLQNDELGSDGERCIDAFVKHLSDGPRGKDVRLRLGEIKLNTQVRTIAFEIKSRQSLTNPNSVGEILLSEFYRDIGFGENFVVARIERRLQQRGLLDKLTETFESLHGVPWRSADGRDDLMTVRRRLAKVLPQIDPKEYPDEQSALQALTDMFRHEKLTAEGIADELVAWVDAQKATGGKTQHLVFVIDEMGTFIGDSNERIGELNSLAEMIGNKGKGKVWLIVTSQQDLEKVVDRTNFQPALVGRLNARFELKPHLISDEINKVVSERILKKRPAEEGSLKALYAKHEGHIANLADIKASRRLGSITERSFIDSYPFLPHQVRLAQDIFEALSGFRISGGVRSMIAVVMEALQDLADKPVGVVVSFDQVFDAVENDLLSQEYLGASGVRAIYESDERVPRCGPWSPPVYSRSSGSSSAFPGFPAFRRRSPSCSFATFDGDRTASCPGRIDVDCASGRGLRRPRRGNGRVEVPERARAHHRAGHPGDGPPWRDEEHQHRRGAQDGAAALQGRSRHAQEARLELRRDPRRHEGRILVRRPPRR